MIMLVSAAWLPALFMSTVAADAPVRLSGAEILKNAKNRAIDEILVASRSDSSLLRMNAIEAMECAPERALPLVQMGMDDPNPAVRFAALVMTGKLKFKTLGSTAERLLDDPHPSVRAAAMFAAHECGESVDISALAAMLGSSSPETRGNVAIIFGLMGDPSAIPMMIEMTKRPMHRAGSVQQAIVRLQVAESMLKLGDESVLDAIRAACYSSFDEVRVLAISMLGKFRDRRMETAFQQMVKKPPIEIQLAAGEALARMKIYNNILDIVLQGSVMEIPAVRAQAAFTLGLIPDSQSAARLVTLLEDPHPQVRLTAAAAILRAVSGCDVR